jgi:hypothetical protein
MGRRDRSNPDTGDVLAGSAGAVQAGRNVSVPRLIDKTGAVTWRASRTVPARCAR